MTTRIAQYQGVLQVPLFAAPYTIPVNNGQGYFGLRPHGHYPFSVIKNVVADPSNATINTATRSGAVTVLAYKNTVNLTIGDGSGNFNNNNGQLNDNVLRQTYISALGYGYPVPPYAGAPYSYGPLYLNSLSFALANRSAPALQMGGIDGIVDPYTAYPVGLNALVGVYDLHYEVSGAELPACGIVMIPQKAGALAAISFNVLGFPLFSGINYIDPSLVYSNNNSLFISGYIIPDSKNKNNMVIEGSYNGVRTGFDFVINPINNSMVNSYSGLLFLRLDDSYFDTYFQNGVGKLQPTPRGWILTGDTREAFISIDFTKWWEIKYVSAATGVPNISPGYSTSSGENYGSAKTIDINGVFWQTGAQTTSGGITKPLFSLGYNLPFTPPPFPAAIPPIDIPCWDPCLSMDAPFNSVFE